MVHVLLCRHDACVTVHGPCAAVEVTPAKLRMQTILDALYSSAQGDIRIIFISASLIAQAATTSDENCLLIAATCVGGQLSGLC